MTFHETFNILQETNLSIEFPQKSPLKTSTMASKQKKTLLGAVVALILVATIVVVALAVSGCFSPCNKTPSAVNAEGVKEVLKAVEEAMKNEEYKGGVYIKVQMQYLDKDNNVIEKKLTESMVKKEVKKVTLQKVTVYGATKKDATHDAVLEAMKNEKCKDAVVVGKAVEFKDITVDCDKVKDIPVLKELLEKYQQKGANFGAEDDKEGKEKVDYVQIEKKPTV